MARTILLLAACVLMLSGCASDSTFRGSGSGAGGKAGVGIPF